MKNILMKIDEIKKNPNGKAIFFFGFYLLFFIILFLWIHLAGNKNALTQEYEKGDHSSWNQKNILFENFYYDYKFYIDDTLYDYYGKMLGREENFKFNNYDYYKNGEDYFINQGTWVKTEDPFLYRELVEPANIMMILDSASFVSKTEYEDLKEEYHYVISSNTLNKLLYQEDTDYEDVPDGITVFTNQNNEITAIELQLDSFCQYHHICNSHLKVSLSYELFGEVRDIKNIH